LWTTQVRCPQAPQAKQQQKKRTFDVLQNADSFTRYGQGPAMWPATLAQTYMAGTSPAMLRESMRRRRQYGDLLVR
jgi:hypothetical protein